MTTIYHGELIKDDDTYLKLLVKSGDRFILISGGAIDAKKWRRFTKIEDDDYFSISDTSYDAIAFKPSSDVYFLGFGLLNSYEKLNFTLKFKYNVDGQESNEFVVDMTQEMLVEDKILEVDF